MNFIYKQMILVIFATLMCCGTSYSQSDTLDLGEFEVVDYTYMDTKLIDSVIKTCYCKEFFDFLKEYFVDQAAENNRWSAEKKSNAMKAIRFEDLDYERIQAEYAFQTDEINGQIAAYCQENDRKTIISRGEAYPSSLISYFQLYIERECAKR